MTKDDRELLIGRADDADRFSSEVQSNRLVILTGESGVGKSSLLNAGLMQELIAEPRHRAGDHRTLSIGQLGLGGEEPIQLAAEDGIGVVAELAE